MGRPPVLRHDDIVSAAIVVGFEELSMPRVAAALNVRHSALYRYFSSRDLLVAAAIDRIAEGVEWPEPVTAELWRSQLQETFRLLWTALGDHPGLAKEIRALRFTTNKLLSRIDRLPVELVDIGFSASDALYTVYTGLHFTLGSALMADGARSPGADETNKRRLFDQSAAWTDHRTHDAFAAMVEQSDESWFDTQIALILDGVAARNRTQEPT